MYSIVSHSHWIQIIIKFDDAQLSLLKSSQCYLYLLQGLKSTNSRNCHLSFGGSIALNQVKSDTLNILVDQFPFWIAAYADRGSIPSTWHSNYSDWLSSISVKQSLVHNFFEIDSTGSSSPKISFANPDRERSQQWNNYILGLSNKSRELFYIGLGRAFQWSEGQDYINHSYWESLIGCNCFFYLDSRSTVYFNNSPEVILLISSQQWKSGDILPEELPGYSPCCFNLQERETIRLAYDKNGWRRQGEGKGEFNILSESPIKRENIFAHLVKPLESPFSPKKPPVLKYGDRFTMCTLSNKDYIVSAKYESLAPLFKYYYPKVSVSDRPIELVLSGGEETVRDGDIVKIETTEKSVGKEKFLGSWTTPSLYYEKDGWGKKQEWIIRKKDNSDPVIYYGDAVYLINRYWTDWYSTDHWLCIKDSSSYLTTRKKADTYWLIDQ